MINLNQKCKALILYFEVKNDLHLEKALSSEICFVPSVMEHILRKTEEQLWSSIISGERDSYCTEGASYDGMVYHGWGI